MFLRSIALLFGLTFFATVTAYAQGDPERVEPGKYVLGGITVSGKLSYNENTVVNFTGLEKGQFINVPGEEISAAIKKLWRLGLFSDVNFYESEIRNDTIFLDLAINELPKLSDVKLQGVKKGKIEGLLKDTDLKKGKYVNENLITNTKNYIENKYRKDGYFNTKVHINIIPDSTNTVKMVVNVDRGKKVRISKINFTGNDKISSSKLKKSMKDTKQIAFPNPLRLFKPSKFIADKYKEDKVKLIDKYKERGYRDARIIKDTVIYDAKTNRVAIDMQLEEGRKYYFGDIRFLGNTIYSNQLLNQVLGIKKGDVYNGVLLQERVANPKPDADDITNMYQNNGYLFSNINAVETRTANDTIDFEIRIVEGPIAYFNKITVVGNDKTNDKVIYRELNTRPGQKWNKENVMNTIRELGALGFFDPESIRPDVKNADPASGTVDVEWHVTEKGSSQIELQGGYGGGGFIGTLAFSLNNFSAANAFKKEAYQPLPMGDGQKLSLRLQGSTYFQTYSLSFTEPWMGGKKPIQMFSSLSYSKQFSYNYSTRDVNRTQSFTISSATVGVSKRLSSPDKFMTLSHSLSFQYYALSNYNIGLFKFGDGTSRNLAYTVELTRNNRGHNPIFPIYGSLFTVSFSSTFPYSLVNGIDYAALKDQLEYKKRSTSSYTGTDGQDVHVNDLVDTSGNKVDPANYKDAAVDEAKYDQKRFNWLEYYKFKFKGDWYTKLLGSNEHALVLRSLVEFGWMGAYDQNRGLVPFQRFFLGGDGMANYALDGREVIMLRGYPNQSLSPVGADGSQIGATVYNRFSLELRYPITLKPQASIFPLVFAEAGNSWNGFSTYQPFNIKRSAGFGLRVFMQAFGMLGIDFGYGFDPLPGYSKPNGWETHFIIGQQF